MEPLLTTKEAAGHVNLSREFLYRNSKRIPACYRAGRAIRWDVKGLREWMRQQAEKDVTNE